MKVLLVDDDPDVGEPLRDALDEAGGWQVIGRGFGEVAEALTVCRPDFVVLDLIEGSGADASDSGNASFERIWETWFCPVIVYSAFPDQQRFESHPLVRCVQKGLGSEDRVRDHLEQLRPQAEMIAAVHTEFDRRIREALRDSTHLLRAQLAEAAPTGTPLARAVRRLVAARVDEEAYGEGPLQAWERFVVPPLGENLLLTADLLRRRDTEWTDPNAFRLILTPSCDLVRHGDQPPRADSVLVARCETPDQIDILKTVTKRQQRKKKLKPLLNAGAAGRHVFIPRFRDCVPSMVANLKRLELLDWDQIVIANGDTAVPSARPVYERVASTDSPFREMVAWVYLQVAGRPGLPDLDEEAWLSELLDSVDGAAGS